MNPDPILEELARELEIDIRFLRRPDPGLHEMRAD
jgi:hypothetical protein